MLALSAWWLSQAWRGNRDLAEGREALFMDERITYDQVAMIYSAQGRHEFWRSLRDGGEHRYGRIYFAVTAFFSYLPWRWMGAPGLVLGQRMTQAIFVLAVAWILAWSAGGGGHSILLLALVLAMPYSSYYGSMPKPEPLQVLFIAVFFWIWSRDFSFSGAWIWLGLAVGAKISALPLAAAVLVLGWLWAPQRSLRGMATAGLAFAAGWVVAVPILAEGRLGEWLHWIRSNAGNGDDPAVGYRDWLANLSSEWFRSFGWMAAALAPAVWLGVKAWRRAGQGGRKSRLGLAMMLGAALWALAIVFGVKRVWGFYLWPAACLGCSGALILAAEAWAGREGRRVSLLLCLALGIGLLAPSLVRSQNEWQALAGRSGTALHLQRIGELAALKEWMHARSQAKGRPLKVFVDPDLYKPDPGPAGEALDFWGNFGDWQAGLDGVAFVSPHDEASPGREEHLADSRGHCAGKPCYRLALVGPDSLRVYEKVESKRP